MVHGVPNRVDRLRGLGNSVVPQVAEWISRRILAAQCDREIERCKAEVVTDIGALIGERDWRREKELILEGGA